MIFKKVICTFLMFLVVVIGFSFDSKVSVDTTKFYSLKAVLVVGEQQSLTVSAIEAMDKLADLFMSRGVKVERYYDDKAIWEDIKNGANDANFFVYSGHGSRVGEGGTAGGICVNSIVSPSTMKQELKLADNALVMFKSVCGGAGSSASDDSDIGISEAVKRVTDYSQPFFEIGAGAYYANNHGNGCINFLNNFFTGLTISECFISSASSWDTIELSKEFMHDSKKQISVASDDWGGTSTHTSYINGVKKVEERPSFKEYDIAYVGNPNFTINDMME